MLCIRTYHKEAEERYLTHTHGVVTDHIRVTRVTEFSFE